MTLIFRRRTALGFVQLSRIFSAVAIASLALAGAELATAKAPDPAKATAQRLVTDAAQAEIAGDPCHSLSLLNQAVRTDSENKSARWQLGRVQLDGGWVAVEEAQRRNAADPIQTEYRERKAIVAANLDAQLALARWCRKKHLTDEAEYHWASVLLLDPNNADALKALDLIWSNDQLVTRDEHAAQKKQSRAARIASDHWEPIITKWRRAITGRDLQDHDVALNEIRAVSQIDAIPSIEAVTLGQDAYDTDHAKECLQIALAFIDALGEMPEQAATESLLRHAVLAPGYNARYTAATSLKSRPQADYVPLLLGGLAMPIESSYQVFEGSDGCVSYSHSLYREGQFSDQSAEIGQVTLQHVLPGRDLVWRRAYKRLEDWTDLGIAQNTRRSETKYAANAATIEQTVQRENARAQALCERIIPTLTIATGNQFSTAKEWWTWWRESNEYDSSEHPVDRRYYSDTQHCYCGQMCDTVRSIPSCFVEGTLVWTNRGTQPIETITPGDQVLSQDVDTGELKFKPVIATTTRPPSPILRITLDGAQLSATKGHPFWVTGVGWQMAKELDKDDALHGINGCSRIRAIEPTADAVAYNLVVADFNTYFVGDSGVLVHDNTPRRPTLAIVPGLAKK